jgi:outer membrane lipoprotein SlyB
MAASAFNHLRRRFVMTTMNKFGAILAVSGAIALAGCETMGVPAGSPASGTANSGNTYQGYGVVNSIELVQQGAAASSGIGGSGIGLGTIAGAVVGGVLGNQVGGGTGRTVATVAGAAGGAYVGHELENRQQPRTADQYRVVVRMSNGSYQTLMQSTVTDIRVGDRVQIDNGIARRY